MVNIKMAKDAKASDKVSTYNATDNLYFLMRLQGYLMPQRFKFAYVVYAACIIGSGTLYLPFGFTRGFFKFEHLTKDLGALFTTLQISIDVYGGSIKILCLGLMLHKLHATRELIEKLDARCTEADEIAEQRSVIRFGHKIVVVIISIFWTYSISTCLGAIANGRPPFSLYLPFIDWRNSSWEFWLVNFIEFLMIDMCCIQQGINDTYPIVYVCILRAHIRILKMRIRRLDEIGVDLSAQENLEKLKMCIKDHKVILDLQRTISPVISVTVFIQFSLTAIMTGLTLINVTLFSTDFSVRLGSFSYLAALAAQTFPICYFAQCLQNESADLADCIFHCQWFNQNLQYRKLLIFFLQRTQNVIEFTAGKLFPITLGSFLGIAKFSFSLYTLIKSMDLESKVNIK